MTLRLRAPKVRKIKIAKPKVRTLLPASIAAALGAEPTAVAIAGNLDPLSLFRLRTDLFEQLRSQVGQSAMDEGALQKKIPLSEENWEQLEELAKTLADVSAHSKTSRIREITPRQVAGRLLGLALQEVCRERQANKG